MTNLYARAVFFVEHIAAKGIETERHDWGQPTLVVRDLDANEIFFWDWPSKRTGTVEATSLESAR